jgi:cyclopropane-fatty-acyl-phospholipid synthase
MMNETLLSTALGLTEAGFLPDFIIREGIRQLSRATLEAHRYGPGNSTFLESMRRAPLAPVPHKANEQHYEVAPDFFGLVLGKHRKYSCCYWPEGVTELDEAEALALEETCSRAELSDGQDVLELGCGWGSLSLWMAERYRKSRIVSVSNSAPQRRYIESQAAARGLTNLRVITADMNRFEAPGQYDRVVSVEMFEHMRNYAELLRRIAGWMRPEASLFVHIFCHRKYIYEFETEGAHNWMGRHFFSGGIMPNTDVFRSFGDHLEVAQEWRWSGDHYRKTAEAWLRNLDTRRVDVMPVLERTYGDGESDRWYHRWRVFFMSCAEVFGYQGGSEWLVGHYRLRLR